MPSYLEPYDDVCTLESLLTSGSDAQSIIETPERLAKLREMFKVVPLDVLPAGIQIDPRFPRVFSDPKKGVPVEMFDTIVKSDPTAKVSTSGEVEKCGIYSQWMLNQYVKSGAKSRFGEDLYKIVNLLKVYDRLKGRLPADQRNIMNLKTVDDLKSVVTAIQPFSSEGEDSTGSGQVEKVLDTESWVMLIPKTQAAAIFYGKDTDWCTATESEGYNRFDYYSKQGPLFIAISKQDAKDRYQFHVESEQYMDPSDNPVDGDFFKDHPELGKAIVDYRKKHGQVTEVNVLFKLCPSSVFEMYQEATDEEKAHLLDSQVPTQMAIDGWLKGVWTGKELNDCQRGSPYLLFSEDRSTVSICASSYSDVDGFIERKCRTKFISYLDGNINVNGVGDYVEARHVWDAITDENMRIIERCCLDAGEEYFKDGEADKYNLPDEVDTTICAAARHAMESATESAIYKACKEHLDSAIGGKPYRIENTANAWAFATFNFQGLAKELDVWVTETHGDGYASIDRFVETLMGMRKYHGDLADLPDIDYDQGMDRKEFNENLADYLNDLDPGEEMDKYIEGHREAARHAAVVAQRLYAEHEEWGGMSDLIKRISDRQGIPIDRLTKSVEEKITDPESFTHYVKKYLWPAQHAQALKELYGVTDGETMAESIIDGRPARAVIDATVLAESYLRRIEWMAKNTDPFLAFLVVDLLHPSLTIPSKLVTYGVFGYETYVSNITSSLQQLASNNERDNTNTSWSWQVSLPPRAWTREYATQKMREYLLDRVKKGEWFRGAHTEWGKRIPESPPYEKMVMWFYRLFKAGLTERQVRTLWREKGNLTDWWLETRTPLDRLTLDQAVHASRLWHAAMARQAAEQEEIESTVTLELVANLKDGVQIFKLGPEHLKAEGDAMGHCVGGNAYRNAEIYSVRRHGKRLYTVQLQRGGYRATGAPFPPQSDARIVQFKAKANRLPGQPGTDVQAAEAVLDYFAKLGVSVRCSDLSELDYAKIRDEYEDPNF